MKLIDLLVQELPKRGGWPKDAKCCAQSVVDNEIYFYDRAYDGQGAMSKYLGELYLTTADETGTDKDGLLTGCVHKEEYEAALAASKQTAWSGEGLPPVGCECELFDCENWNPVIIKFVGEKYVVTERTDLGYEVVYCVADRPERLRPIRTEAERKRDEGVANLQKAFLRASDRDDVGQVIWEYIAEGKIPGIKLAD